MRQVAKRQAALAALGVTLARPQGRRGDSPRDFLRTYRGRVARSVEGMQRLRAYLASASQERLNELRNMVAHDYLDHSVAVAVSVEVSKRFAQEREALTRRGRRRARAAAQGHVIRATSTRGAGPKGFDALGETGTTLTGR